MDQDIVIKKWDGGAAEMPRFKEGRDPWGGTAWVIPKNTEVSPDAGGIWEGKQAAQCDHS